MMKEAQPEIDWEKAYARMEWARQALDPGASLSPQEVERILKDRARALAKPIEEASTPTEALELLVFSLAGERYGIETTYVLEVIPVRELTPVPCTPPFVLGVVNHRGRILTVLDFRRLFELAGQGVPERGRVVAVEAGEMTFGILADAVAGAVRVGVDKVAPPPLTLTGDHQAFIQGVTREMVAVLNLDALARDPRIMVNEE